MGYGRVQIFGDRVQHKGEGTRYSEEGKEGARRGDKVQHRGVNLHMIYK